MTRKSIQSIKFKDLSLEVSNGQTILSNVTLDLPTKSIVWLKGSSGSGKSVIAKILCGLLMPTGGQYLINDEPVSDMSFEEFLPYRCNMGYSFDFGGLISNRDILSNLMLPIQYHNFDFGTVDELIVQVQGYLKTFGLEKVAYERPSAVVGRLRKAACVARAFIHTPQMIILDDPTTGLRADTCVKLGDLILNKVKHSDLQHVFVVSDDEVFMSRFNATVVMLDEYGLKVEQVRAVA